MGRKVHPIGFRLGIIKEHRSRWFATGKQYRSQLAEDRLVRHMVYEELPKAGISRIDIERAHVDEDLVVGNFPQSRQCPTLGFVPGKAE